MAIERMGEVPEFLATIANGQTHDANPVMGNDVSLRGQDVIAADKINELVDAINATDATVANNEEANLAAEEIIRGRLDDLEASVSGSYADGVTARNLRLGLEAGVIETSDNTALSVNSLPISSVGKVGPQGLGASPGTPTDAETTFVAGSQFYNAHAIKNVLYPATSGSTLNLSTSTGLQRYKTFVFIEGNNATRVILPVAGSVPEGTSWLFINMMDAHSLQVGSLTGLAFGYWVEVIRAGSGYIHRIGSGANSIGES